MLDGIFVLERVGLPWYVRTMKTYVVSLVRETQRRATIAERLRALDIPFEFFDAVDGATAQPDKSVYDPDRMITWNRKPLTAGQIGCYMSHYRVWQQLATSDDNFALILEDDTIPLPSLNTLLDSINRLPKNWEVVLLSDSIPSINKHSLMASRNILTANISIDHYIRPGVFTSAYLLHKRGAARLVQNSLPMRGPVDAWNSHSWRDGLVIHRSTPIVAIHSSDHGSTTGTIPRQRLTIKKTIKHFADRTLLISYAIARLCKVYK